MTLDEGVTTFKRELPNWWWSVSESWVLCQGHCGPDSTPGHEADEIEIIDVEISKPSGPRGIGGGDDPTPADVVILMLEKAKAAVAAKQPGAEPSVKATLP
jgi:hypothetical protein